jgi:hypothetical protein
MISVEDARHPCVKCQRCYAGTHWLPAFRKGSEKSILKNKLAGVTSNVAKALRTPAPGGVKSGKFLKFVTLRHWPMRKLEPKKWGTR